MVCDEWTLKYLKEEAHHPLTDVRRSEETIHAGKLRARCREESQGHSHHHHHLPRGIIDKDTDILCGKLCATNIFFLIIYMESK